MTAHIRTTLFDYISGEISPEEVSAVEDHLAHCASCREDLRLLREALRILPKNESLPSDARSEEYWRAFSAEVVGKINTGGRRAPSRIAAAAQWISSFITFHPQPLLAGSGALALVALAVLLLRPAAAPEQRAEADVSVEPAGAEPSAAMLQDYLKKSKVLLIGVTNLKTGRGAPIDLSVERRQSRALVHQARALKTRPLDARSARLVGDVERILIGLANSDDTHEFPEVRVIQSGIRQRNLLFKIRMAESVLDAGSHERDMQ